MPHMPRLEAAFLYAGDVLHGVPGDPPARTVTNVVVRGDGFVDLYFEDGSSTMTQVNSAFCLEAFEVPIEMRLEIRDDFRQAVRDSQRHFPTSGGQA